MKFALMGLVIVVVLGILFVMVPTEKVDSRLLVSPAVTKRVELETPAKDPFSNDVWTHKSVEVERAQYSYKSGLRIAVEGRLRWLGF